MDDQNKNLLLATALSFLVILAWFILFPPPEPQPPQDPALAEQTADGASPPAADPVSPAAAPAATTGGAAGATAETLGSNAPRHRRTTLTDK